MLSHFQQALQLATGCQVDQCVTPLTCHTKLQKHLMVLAHHLWPSSDTQICRSVTFSLLGCGIVFEVLPGQTLEQLIGAQAALGGWGDGLLILLNGCQLPPNSILRNAVYEIVPVKHLSLTAPFYVLQFASRCWAGPLPLGITPAALLCLLGFSQGHGLSLWVNGCELSLDLPLFLPLVGSLHLSGSFLGAGPAPVVGLSDVHIEAEASRLLRRAVPFERFHLLSALDLSHLLTLSMNEAAARLCDLIPDHTEELFGIYCFDGHWMAFSFDRNSRVAQHFDGLYGIPHVAQFIFDTVADHWQLHGWSVQQTTLLQQDFGTHCGVIALINFGAFLGLWTHYSEERALQWYEELMQPRFVGLGQVDYAKAHSQLVLELPKHGVPPEAAAARAAAALKKLGTAPIIRALEAKNVWQALKALGNNTDRPFQWVQHAELEKHVESRGLDKKAPMNKHRKEATAKAKPVVLSPAQVTLPDGAFIGPDGKALPALALDAISHQARGVVIVTHDQALRFVKDGKAVSIDALALLTLSVLQLPPDTKLDFCNLTWPGLLIPSEDPVLIRGTCIQLGDHKVSPARGVAAPAVVETDLIRLLAYRDQLPIDWKKFAQGPLKLLIGHFTCLQFCDCSDTACPKFHPSLEETGFAMVILDAFAWKWRDKDGKGVNALKAVAFTLMVRVPKSATTALMNISGCDGLYTELRSSDQNISHPKFAVVWLHGDHDEARHQLRKVDKALHLVRFHAKYGLRCLKRDEQAVHLAVFPDRKFVDCGISQQFEVGPWPYGATKAVISEFLESFEWTARPLRPTRGGQEGRYWLIGSTEDPPAMVATYADGFLTFSRCKSPAAPKPVPDVIASVKTLQRLAHQDKSLVTTATADPIQEHDPWRNWKLPSGAAASASSASATSKLTELEERLTNRMAEQLQEQIKSIQEEPMDVSGGKIQQLEVTIGELKAQQGQFSNWCQTAADQIASLATQAQHQDARLTSIDAKLDATSQATEVLGTQVGSLQASFKSELTDAMDKQTAMIEAMLNKRARTS